MKEKEYSIFIILNNKKHYKADTFWSTTTNKKDSKKHALDNGKIQKHLLDNLAYILKNENEEKFNNCLIGYEDPDTNSSIITNKIVFKNKYEIIEYNRELKLKRILKK